MRWTAGIALLLLPLTVRSQPEIVPAEHAVYEWMADQRVAGVLPEYRHETLPYDRATVRAHLDTLSAHSARLGASGRYWLDQYRREFFEPLDRVSSIAGDGRAGFLDPDAERTFGYFRDSTWRVSVWGEGVVETRSARGTTEAGGLARSARLTFEANWKNRVGLYTSTLSGTQMTGDAAVLAADPVLAPLYYVARDPANIAGPFDRTTASLRVVGGPFSAEIANERLRYGASVDAPVVLADGADYLPFVRVGLQARSVTVQAVHASLSSQSQFVVDESPGGDRFFDQPQRYLTLHRLDVQPTGWWTWSYTGMVVYGRRGPEIAYLNPLYPVKAAEHALYDRDNTLFSLETTVRPLRGVEGNFTWLVDDLATASLGDGLYGNKWGIQTGFKASVPRTGATVFGEYVRIEPYTYSHRFREDGFYFNSYVLNGFGLGHPLGPNADQVLLGATAWLPLRTRARVSWRYVRKGENPVDPVTGEVTNVGGDVRLGEAPADGRAPFLAGDLFQGPGVRALVEVEPARGVALAVLRRRPVVGRPAERAVRPVRAGGPALVAGLVTWHGAGDATVAYVEVRSWGRVRVAAGAPTGPAGGRPAAAAAFEAQARRDRARVLWFAVRDPADVAPDRPSVVIGAEPVWHVARWPEILARKASVRAQIRRAANKGVVAERWTGARALASPELRAVLADWLDRRGLPPLSFMADPFVLDAPGDRQFVVAIRSGTVVGYLALVPGDETFVEWIIQARDAPNGTAALLLDAAVRGLPQPGTFTLGMVPLSTFAPLSDRAPSLAVRALLAWTRAHATRFYNFQGLERFKAKFVPDAWRPLALVTDGRPVSVWTFHDVAAAFAAPRAPTRFVARALVDAAAEELRALPGRLSKARR